MNEAVEKLLLFLTSNFTKLGGNMSDEITKDQQLPEEMSDEDLEAVAGGTALAGAGANADASKGGVAVSSASAFALDIDVNLGSGIPRKQKGYEYGKGIS